MKMLLFFVLNGIFFSNFGAPGLIRWDKLNPKNISGHWRGHIAGTAAMYGMYKYIQHLKKGTAEKQTKKELSYIKEHLLNHVPNFIERKDKMDAINVFLNDKLTKSEKYIRPGAWEKKMQDPSIVSFERKDIEKFISECTPNNFIENNRFFIFIKARRSDNDWIVNKKFFYAHNIDTMKVDELINIMKTYNAMIKTYQTVLDFLLGNLKNINYEASKDIINFYKQFLNFSTGTLLNEDFSLDEYIPMKLTLFIMYKNWLLLDDGKQAQEKFMQDEKLNKIFI